MKGISKEEHHLIDELSKKTTFFDVFKNTNTRKIEILQTLANSGSMFTLTFLLPLALDKSQAIRNTARWDMQFPSQRVCKRSGY